MKNNENGRSMIEILGVLAIIGVLSVGGIYGFKTAMRKYKANEIVQAASMLFTLARSSNGGEGDCIALSSVESLSNNFGGVNVDMVADATTSHPIINIQIDDTDYDPICDFIRDTVPSTAEYGIGDCGNFPVACP